LGTGALGRPERDDRKDLLALSGAAMQLKILTYNIHKGFTSFNREFVLDELRSALRSTQADFAFLQEVVGDHEGHKTTVKKWPTQPQFEFLADTVWPHYAYARNAVYPRGHHGNVILSRFPILSYDQENLSTNSMEHRGLLHCIVDLPAKGRIHLVCLHLGLTQGGRNQQLDQLSRRIAKLPEAEPLIVGGDFNDWRGRVSPVLSTRHGLREVNEVAHGKKAKTFPSRLPLLAVDRIYFRGFELKAASVLREGVFRELSDHAAVFATLMVKP
jgi:endonuclease/exonuclease/phosphatase family metal-dependent hydrolase